MFPQPKQMINLLRVPKFQCYAVAVSNLIHIIYPTFSSPIMFFIFIIYFLNQAVITSSK